MPRPDDLPESLLKRARAGNDAALGRLLESYRGYLRLIVRLLLKPDLRPNVSGSDLVQETFLLACRGFPDFRGDAEPELAAWLRTILVRTLADQVAYQHAGRRDARRRCSFEAELDQSSQAIHAALVASGPSPSAAAARREQAVLLAEALERLPEPMREVVIGRSLEGTPFEEIAARLGRTPAAVRMLWGRAIRKLTQLMESSS